MQFHPLTDRRSAQKRKAEKLKWRKVGPAWPGLYYYVPSGKYFAHLRRGGRLYRESLRTTDLQFAKRKWQAFRDRLDRTDVRYGRITFVQWLQEHYLPTLRGSPKTLADKQSIILRIKGQWLQARSQPMRDLKESQVLSFLNEQYGALSPATWNGALSLIRDALALAVRDRVLIESPAGSLKYRKRKQPIRLTPTFGQFTAFIADVRSQPFNADARDSADFLEAMGLLGLGQAELSGMKLEHVDLASGRIQVYRLKTDTGFVIPIYPQARALVERLCQGKKTGEHVFTLQQARKALTNACKRLGFPNFTQRSLRRMFITRALERGVDVKVIAQWQGHRDGGKLILDTYSHVRPEHSNRMAQLMTSEQPENVIPITEAQAS